MAAEPILVTGAAGFIGFHVAQRLAASGRAVIGIDNLNAYYGYLLDATTPHMLWSDQCRIRCRSHLYGLLCQPEKQLAS